MTLSLPLNSQAVMEFRSLAQDRLGLLLQRISSSRHKDCSQQQVESSTTPQRFTTFDMAIDLSLARTSSLPVELRALIKLYLYRNCDIREAVALWLRDPKQAMLRHGHISYWNTSHVTDMSALFSKGAYFFNEPLIAWDVSNVTTMSGMFRGASQFNQPLHSWDVSNVTDMSDMFKYCESFNQPLASWNVARVKNMNGMFAHATAFNQVVHTWDVHNVRSMRGMFHNACNCIDVLMLFRWQIRCDCDTYGMYFNTVRDLPFRVIDMIAQCIAYLPGLIVRLIVVTLIEIFHKFDD